MAVDATGISDWMHIRVCVCLSQSVWLTDVQYSHSSDSLQDSESSLTNSWEQKLTLHEGGFLL